VTVGKVADGMDAKRARERVLDQIRRTDLTTDTPAVRDAVQTWEKDHVTASR